MTTLELRPRSRAATAAAIAFAALGSAALMARPIGYLSAVATALVGLAGLAVPLARARRADPSTWIAVTATGCAAFAVASRWALAPRLHLPVATVGFLVLAALAEEAFFRRALYGVLEPWGHAVALGVTALLFALVHVPVFGIRVLPLDVAAGTLLGWQRYATGGWTAPGLTHILANLIQLR